MGETPSPKPIKHRRIISRVKRKKSASLQELNEKTTKWKRKYTVNAVGIVILVLAGLGIAYLMSEFSTQRGPREPPDPVEPLPPSASKAQVFPKAAVCSDAELCSAIGRDMLAKNGTAVDAALATLFCNGLVNSQSMGLGGGFIMMIWDQERKMAHSVIAREQAPKNVTSDLYEFNHGATRRGPLAVAVPGELKGYWEVHQKFGRLSWQEIIQPTIDLCEEGYPMNKHQRDSLDFREELIHNDPTLSSMFVNPKTGQFFNFGTVIRPQAICSTFRLIAYEGGTTLYNGTLANLFVEDLQKLGGVITLEDMANYEVRWKEPVSTKLSGDVTVLGPPLPGSGLLLAFILSILDGFHFNPADLSSTEKTVQAFHYTVESFKYAFAKRGELGDPNFSDVQQVIRKLTSPQLAANVRQVIRMGQTSGDPTHYGAQVFSKDHHGTAHVSVIDAEGNAVSVTSSINLYFGAGITSKQTGIIFNSGIDDFSFPDFENYFGLGWSPANGLGSRRMSLSSMSPTIVLENGNVRMVVGASGGTKITTSVALVIMRHLWFGEDLKTAVDASRFHHQLLPSTISYEYGMLKSVHDGLKELGHNLTRFRNRGSVVCALAKIGDFIHGNADYRKGGEVYGV